MESYASAAAINGLKSRSVTVSNEALRKALSINAEKRAISPVRDARAVLGPSDPACKFVTGAVACPEAPLYFPSSPRSPTTATH